VSVVRDRVHAHLANQFLLVILPLTFVFIGLGAWLLHGFVMQRVNAVTEKSLVAEAKTIEDVLQHALMINDADMLQQMVFDVGVQRQVNRIRLLSHDGVVLASLIPDEIGIRLNRLEPRCQACHTPEAGQLSVTESQPFITADLDVVVVAEPIENRIVCQGCHSEDGEYLGLILVEFPAEQMKDWHTLFDTGLFLGALLVGVLISGSVYTTLSNRVIDPLKSLALPRNNENPIPGENEIELIARRMKVMEEELGNWEKRLADQHRNIDVIFSLQYEIGDPPSIEKFFRRTLGIVQKVTGYESIRMRLYEPRTQSFRVMAQSGMSPALLKELETVPASAGFHAEVVQTHLPAFTSEMSSDPRITSTTPIQEGYQSMVCIPLLALDDLVGTIQIVLKDKHIWDGEELRWLALIGRRIGLLIHHIQLSERLRDLAVLEERSRLAQEIHDGLAQLIGSLRLWSEEALISLEEHEPDAAQKTLRKIESAARDAYASLREEMLGLRDTILPSKDLSAVIAEYLNRFQRQWGIQTQVALDECAQGLHTWPISPAAEIQLLRIFQEGLTNVRRHANARCISVRLSCEDGWLKVHIQDDGAGFDLENIPDDRLGLRIMRERVASAGGRITINSEKGQGTRLEIVIPMRMAAHSLKGDQ